MIAETMNEGFIALLDETVISENVSVQFLEGLAKVRFALSVVAEVMERQTSSKHMVETSAQAKQLVYTACNVCCDLNVNVIDITGRSDTTGPIVYLMRLLVRQYGMPCLETVADAYSWVIPRQLRNAKVVGLLIAVHVVLILILRIQKQVDVILIFNLDYPVERLQLFMSIATFAEFSV